MFHARRKTKRLLRYPLALAVLLAVACTPPPGPYDYRETYPIKVEMRTFSLAVRPAATGSEPNRAEEARFESFIADYMRRGRSFLVLTTAAGDANEAESRVAAVRDRLVASGVRADDIAVQADQAPAVDEGTVVLSYQAYAAIVPTCGDWSGAAGFNPTNRPHTDYGCSYQRNIGLMLSDPGTLLKTQGLGPVDGARATKTMRDYGEGKIPAAPPKAAKK